ncbi:MAG: ABC transporter permease [Hyphomicrobiales bacterium]|nr:ABC transporter permease [Hyphomicrobiales bacterium]
MGTIWLMMGLVLIVSAKGMLFAGILNLPADRIIPNIAIGLLLWRLFSGIVLASCTAFSGFKSNFESGYFPLFIPIFEVVVRQIFEFVHGIIPMMIIVLIFLVPQPTALLFLIVGLSLSLLTVLPVGYLLAVISTRYRDIAALIQSSMKLIYFMTPVIWLPEMAKGALKWVLIFNPFFHLIEIVRAPLIGQPIDPANWVVVLGIAITSWLLVAFSYRLYGRRILLWL